MNEKSYINQQKYSNRDVYTHDVFDHWAKRTIDDLFTSERWFIEKYLIDRRQPVVEAGTGSGRIAFNIEKMGFDNVIGFDFVQKLVQTALESAKELNSKVKFQNADAVNLTCFQDEQFGYLVYLQQMICFIPRNEISSALKTSFRIAKKKAIALFSFLNYDGRPINRLLSLAVNTARFFRGEELSWQSLPWLNFDNGFNKKFLAGNQACNYWVREKEICELLEEAGYNILECTTQDKLGVNSNKKGILYVACQKP